GEQVVQVGFFGFGFGTLALGPGVFGVHGAVGRDAARGDFGAGVDALDLAIVIVDGAEHFSACFGVAKGVVSVLCADGAAQCIVSQVFKIDGIVGIGGAVVAGAAQAFQGEFKAARGGGGVFEDQGVGAVVVELKALG